MIVCSVGWNPGYVLWKNKDYPQIADDYVRLLASDAPRNARLDIRRVAFARPRAEVVAALDADHQGLPVLIFGDEQPAPADAQVLGDKRFVTDTRRILDLLAERHGFPKVH